eukprot:CAMPEP_0119328066 /NCGR_PEP_ID=MMETSP1333-20130426/72344_1 /TAXON_ID=418940 /ORGANISM="Scyphosphaera apsteinii, Strain RCC1455" /LENGTH=197 /DNA_ID=CAMNT_0007336817 /DNA_START=828 /DNA_END=1423 /DNA_ORIENTATION=-
MIEHKGGRRWRALVKRRWRGRVRLDWRNLARMLPSVLGRTQRGSLHVNADLMCVWREHGSTGNAARACVADSCQCSITGQAARACVAAGKRKDRGCTNREAEQYERDDNRERNFRLPFVTLGCELRVIRCVCHDGPKDSNKNGDAVAGDMAADMGGDMGGDIGGVLGGDLGGSNGDGGSIGGEGKSGDGGILGGAGT